MNVFERWKATIAARNPRGEALFLLGASPEQINDAFAEVNCAPTRAYRQLMQTCGGFVTEDANVIVSDELLLGYSWRGLPEGKRDIEEETEFVTEFYSYDELKLDVQWRYFYPLCSDGAGSHYLVPFAEQELEDSPLLFYPKAENAFVRYQSLSALFQTLALAWEEGVLSYQLKRDIGELFKERWERSESGYFVRVLIPLPNDPTWRIVKDDDAYARIAARFNPRLECWRG